MPEVYEYDGWSFAKLRQQRGRAHFLLEQPYRFVTVLLSTRPAEPHRLYCIDSPCYHAGGPLGEGDVVEIEDMLCLCCPWHKFLVSLEDGREVTLDAAAHSGEGNGEEAEEEEEREDAQVRRHTAAAAAAIARSAHVHTTTTSGSNRDDAEAVAGCRAHRGQRVQRTHTATLDEATGILTITVEDSAAMQAAPLLSDKTAQDLREGALCMQIAHIRTTGLNKV